MNKNSKDLTGASRRAFIKKSGIVLLGSSLALHTDASASLFSSKKSQLKVGLIGCGGRGTGAAAQAMAADPDVIITAMGDVFEDRLEGAYAALVKIGGDKVK